MKHREKIEEEPASHYRGKLSTKNALLARRPSPEEIKGKMKTRAKMLGGREGRNPPVNYALRRVSALKSEGKGTKESTHLEKKSPRGGVPRVGVIESSRRKKKNPAPFKGTLPATKKKSAGRGLPSR